MMLARPILIPGRGSIDGKNALSKKERTSESARRIE
jgi:hypothetical protein